jgi:acetyl esterase/lipase
MGGSAGGHLALFLGVTGNVPEFEGDGPNKEQSSKVQAVADFYGPSDLTKSYGRSVDAAEVLPLFLGGDVYHARAMHLRASPLYWVTPDAAPTLAIQGTKDRYVNPEQSVWIVDKLMAAGVDAELEMIAGADHGFKGADEERAELRMIEFFGRYLK